MVTARKYSTSISMIKSFRHKGLKDFFEKGITKGIQSSHSKKLRRILSVMNEADKIEDVSLPGFRLHSLKGEFKGFYSITVNANWRVIFKFESENIYIVDYSDYH